MSGARFRVGDRVRVLSHTEGNPRTPQYTKGRTGMVTACHGVIDNPLDHHQPYPPLYSVIFPVTAPSGRPGRDAVVADLHEEWLEPV